MESPEFNFNKITISFVRNVRGSDSQESLSKKLGFEFNIVNRWENGRRGFYWDDFLLLARMKNLEVSPALESICGFKFSPYPSSSEVLEKMLIPSAKEVLVNTFSKIKINRLCRGETKLLFEEFIFILDILYGRHEQFMRLLGPQEMKFKNTSLPSALTLEEYIAKRSDILCSVVRIGLCLGPYKNSSEPSIELLADLLSLEGSTVERCLNDLMTMELVYKQGDRYIPRKSREVTSAVDKRVSLCQARKWRRKICNYAESNPPPSDDIFSANLLFSTDKQTEERIYDLCRQLYMDINNILAAAEMEDVPEDRIRYLDLTVFNPLRDQKLEQDI